MIRGVLKAQTAYLQSLETSDMFSTPQAATEESETQNGSKKKAQKARSHPAQNSQSKALKDSLAALTGLHGKLYGDMPFAKREVAWGKLDAKDVDQIFVLFRGILIPMIGMSTITDIFERIAERRGWVNVPGSKFNDIEAWEQCHERDKEEEKQTWNEIMKTLHEPFAVVSIHWTALEARRSKTIP